MALHVLKRPTPLLRRVAAGRTNLVVDLIAADMDRADLTIHGVSLLEWCAFYCDACAVRLLVARGANLKRLGSDLGLHAAAAHGHWQLCQYLLENGAPVDEALPDTGETPLHAALIFEDRGRYDAVVAVLLAAQADVNAATVLDAPTGAFLRDCRTRGETPLHRATAFGTAGTIQFLLDAGARPDRPDGCGETPLAWATWHRRPADIIRLLCYGTYWLLPQFASDRARLVGDPRLGGA